MVNYVFLTFSVTLTFTFDLDLPNVINFGRVILANKLVWPFETAMVIVLGNALLCGFRCLTFHYWISHLKIWTIRKPTIHIRSEPHFTRRHKMIPSINLLIFKRITLLVAEIWRAEILKWHFPCWAQSGSDPDDVLSVWLEWCSVSVYQISLEYFQNSLSYEKNLRWSRGAGHCLRR